MDVERIGFMWEKGGGSVKTRGFKFFPHAFLYGK